VNDIWLQLEAMDNSNKINFEWKEFHQDVSHSFKQIRKDLDFSDVTLVCGDEHVEAHKVVLSSASSFFKNLLKKNRHPYPLIYFRGVMKDDIKSILDFIYLGEVSILEENLDSFLSLAKEFELRALSQNTETTKNLITENNQLRIRTPILINKEIDLKEPGMKESPQV
jgi:hypothetical protein